MEFTWVEIDLYRIPHIVVPHNNKKTSHPNQPPTTVSKTGVYVPEIATYIILWSIILNIYLCDVLFFIEWYTVEEINIMKILITKIETLIELSVPYSL